MKICTKCHQKKEKSDFFLKNVAQARFHTQCKECYRLQRRSHYKEHYEKYSALYKARAKKRREQLRIEFRNNMLNYLKDKCCVTCGMDDIRTLEFDHIVPETKAFGVARAVSLGYSWSEVLEEIAKCQILCANCHKVKTAESMNWYKK